jgi:hypothetical protein
MAKMVYPPNHGVAGRCQRCDAIFIGTNRQKYCSYACRKAVTYLPSPTINGLPSGTVGAMAELLVCTDLLKHGYYVFRAVSPSCYCDLFAKKDEKSFEIEVRTASQRHGKIEFAPKYQKGVNCLALFVKETCEILYRSPGTLEEIAI